MRPFRRARGFEPGHRLIADSAVFRTAGLPFAQPSTDGVHGHWSRRRDLNPRASDFADRRVEPLRHVDRIGGRPRIRTEHHEGKGLALFHVSLALMVPRAGLEPAHFLVQSEVPYQLGHPGSLVGSVGLAPTFVSGKSGVPRPASASSPLHGSESSIRTSMTDSKDRRPTVERSRIERAVDVRTLGEVGYDPTTTCLMKAPLLPTELLSRNMVRREGFDPQRL